MRSTEFLIEATPAKIKAMAEKIKQDCQPYLQAIGGQVSTNTLYRGLNKSKPLFQKIPCPVNRQPRDTPLHQHIIADAWFLKKTGIAYRSNSLFCTGNMREAHGYGTIHAVFPIGHFDFCFSPVIDDMSVTFENELDFFGGLGSEIEEKEFKSQVDKVLAAGNYQHNTSINGFLSGISSKHEIMLHANSFYLIRKDNGSAILDELAYALGNI